MNWKLSDAKKRLNEVLTRAVKDGPQTISYHNEEFVVLSKKTYEQLTGKRTTFKDWLLNCPGFDDMERQRSHMRQIEM